MCDDKRLIFRLAKVPNHHFSSGHTEEWQARMISPEENWLPREQLFSGEIVWKDSTFRRGNTTPYGWISRQYGFVISASPKEARQIDEVRLAIEKAKGVIQKAERVSQDDYYDPADLEDDAVLAEFLARKGLQDESELDELIKKEIREFCSPGGAYEDCAEEDVPLESLGVFWVPAESTVTDEEQEAAKIAQADLLRLERALEKLLYRTVIDGVIQPPNPS